jgi:hypothetical protein
MSALLATRLCIVLAVALIVSGGFFTGHILPLIGFSLGFGGFWLANTHWRWYFFSTLSFLALLACAVALSSWHGAWWALGATLVLIGAWDLEAFSDRLKAHDRVEPGLERAHLQQIGLVALVGFIAASIALIWSISLNLGSALFLAFVSIVALILVLRAGGRSAG